jgi:murein DD-endopeptidase MepM/ murein hydrolase activator NlpD
LLIKVLANRAITVTGSFDDRRLFFVPEANRAWAVTGVPIGAKAGARPIQLAIADRVGTSVSTTVSVMVVEEHFAFERIYVPSDRVNLLDPQVAAEDAQRLDAAFATTTPQRLWQGTFVWPHVGQVTSPFGMSRTYNNGRIGHHGGMDIAGEVGAPVVAANSGRVALAAPLKVHGNAVVLDHGWGVYSSYYHLAEILVQEGQQVAQGQTIGRLGNTGLSTGAHLHWEMTVGGVPVDPLEWTSRQIPE